MRRVLHCIPTIDQGGAERMLVALANRSSDDEHSIVTIFRGQNCFEVAPHVRCYQLGAPRNSLLFLLTLPVLVVRYLGILRRERPAVVVGWLYYGALMSSLARLTGQPVVWSLHAASFEVSKAFRCTTRFAVRLCAWLSRGVPRVIHYCSEEGRITHEKLGFSPLVGQVVENGIDLGMFTEPVVPRPAAAAARGPLVIGCVARFEPQKDHANLFSALSLLRQRHTDFRALFAGRGCVASNAEFMKLARDAGVDAMVEPMGIVPDMAAFYRKIDVLVLPSSHGESMPLVVLEAMAAGKIVVVTDVGYTRAMVGDYGLVVPAKDHAALADALSRVAAFDQSEILMRRSGGQWYVQQSFSLETAAAKWHALFDRISEIDGVQAAQSKEYGAPEARV